MKKRQKLLNDEQWKLIEPLLPPPKRRKDGHGQATKPQSRLFRRDLVDFANRRSLAFSARRVSFSFDLLAEAATVGREGRLAASVANPAGRFGPERSVAMGRGLSRRQFCSS